MKIANFLNTTNVKSGIRSNQRSNHPGINWIMELNEN